MGILAERAIAEAANVYGVPAYAVKLSNQREPNISAARRRAARNLFDAGLPVKEICYRLGKVHATTVRQMLGLRKGRERHRIVLQVNPPVIPCPDLSGEWAI